MCRSCEESPDGAGRRCTRTDGFTSIEGDQRSRSRGLNNAADALRHGDPQAAVNQLENARRAQRNLDGTPEPAAATPEPTETPHRDVSISPSSLDHITTQIEYINRARTNIGAPPLKAEVTRQAHAFPGDDIMLVEQMNVRLTGATKDELDQIAFRGLSTDAEKRVSTTAVLRATAATMRLDNSGRYLSRGDGGDHSTPARVSQYVADSPDGALRARYAPNGDDAQNAAMALMWARQMKPSNDYDRAVRNALSHETMSPREIGTVASAFAGYQRHMGHMQKARARQAAAPAVASAPAVGEQGLRGPAQAQAPAPSRTESRWFNNVGDRVVLPAHVEVAQPLHFDGAAQPNWLYVMRTPDGDLVKWIAVDNDSLRAGDDITLWGQVKGHTTFRGERQTEMYYCRAQRNQVAAR